MKTLIMLSAFPASGKTTWAKEYQKNHENTLILNSDDIRMELTGGDYHDRSKQKEVWELFEKRIHEYGQIDGVTVILDALNDVNEVRLKYLKTTPEYDKKVLVLFPSTLERSMEFNSKRPECAKVPDDIVKVLYE
ncbi:MAG: ATP-binding protein, partial [Bacilli bacterium]|nr:ATP-binding protein [Bacilli bacterium]